MSLPFALSVFVISAAVLVRASTSLVAAADQIAERSGLGRLFVGTLLLAFATSMPEVLVDVTAAATGAPDLAIGDLFGSSMANMAILALVDLHHRGKVWPSIELGHARVAAVAIGLTALAALGIDASSPVSLGWVGPMPILIFALYVAAIAWFHRAPGSGGEQGTPLQEPTGWSAEAPPAPWGKELTRFGLATMVIIVSAPTVTLSVESIAVHTGVTHTVLGVTLLAATTSMPELTASLAATRMGAHDLAVGNLFGSNAANMAVLLFIDLAYLDGPVLAAVSSTLMAAAVSAILLMAIAVAAIVGGTETRIRRLEPDAVALLVAYVGILVALAFA